MTLQLLVHDLLARSAERFPDRPAVVDGDRSATYGELESRANRLGHLLIEHGVEPGDRVGIFLDKSLEALLGIYGVLKAGAVYVPFDPQAPESRLGYIARNAGIRCLITGKEKASAWSELRRHGAPVETLVVLNATAPAEAPQEMTALPAAALDTYSDVRPGVKRAMSDLSYVLYTSGSTGVPKGVMLTHLNAMTFVDWSVDEFSVTADDRLSNHAPLHFDLSVFDLFAAAQAGAAVVLVPPGISVFPIELARFIATQEISVWYSVPSVLTMLVLRGNLASMEFQALRTLLFAGEVFPTKYLLRLMKLLPKVRFCNLYGPTETNVCTWYDVPREGLDPAKTIPIGKPIANVDVLVTGEDGRTVPRGEVGELRVQGPTVMDGYWDDAERSAQVLSNVESLSERVYRTGDLVQEAPDSNLLFLGRRDAQVKSRGYRIELGDIEAALNAHPLVVECAVVAVPDEVFTNKIKAFVVVRDGASEGDLVGFCRERLPRYMIPDLFEFREGLPKSSTGKIDRKMLAAQQAPDT